MLVIELIGCRGGYLLGKGLPADSCEAKSLSREAGLILANVPSVLAMVGVGRLEGTPENVPP